MGKSKRIESTNRYFERDIASPIRSFAQFQAQLHYAKKAQSAAIIRRVEREQMANRRHYPIKLRGTDISNQRLVKTHYDAKGNILDAYKSKEENIQQDNFPKTKSRSLTKIRKK